MENSMEEGLLNNNSAPDNEAPDFNNPPLRRMRTSLVNRRRMEEVQQLETHSKYAQVFLKDAIWYSILITYLCICYFVPTLFGLSRSPECEMKTGYANAMFGMVVIGTQAIIRILFLLGYLFKRVTSPVPSVTEYVQKQVLVVSIIDGLVTLIGWTVFFYWSQALWGHIGSSQTCTEGRNLWDFVNWLMILSVTVWPTIFMTILLLVGICCLPCIISGIKEYLRSSREERAKKFEVIDHMIKKKYNADDFAQHKECAICMCEFGEDDNVSPLPCNTNHYFHAECIEHWIKENPSCPMCRTPITPEALEELSKKLDN